MWTLFKVFVESVTTLLLLFMFLFWGPWSLWDLSSLTRDQTCAPCVGRLSPHHWTIKQDPGYKAIVSIWKAPPTPLLNIFIWGYSLSGWHRYLPANGQIDWASYRPLGSKIFMILLASVFLVVSDSLQPYGLQPARLLCPRDSPGKNTRVGCHALLQGMLLTQGLNLGLLLCRWILNHLSHQGSPKFSSSQTNPK